MHNYSLISQFPQSGYRLTLLFNYSRRVRTLPHVRALGSVYTRNSVPMHFMNYAFVNLHMSALLFQMPVNQRGKKHIGLFSPVHTESNYNQFLYLLLGSWPDSGEFTWSTHCINCCPTLTVNAKRSDVFAL